MAIHPHNRDAERALLGSILRDNGIIAETLGLIQANDFFVYAHGILFRKFAGLHTAGRAVDIVTVADSLSDREMEEIGGHVYLAGLHDAAPCAANYHHYAAIIRENSTRRRIIQAANETIARALDPASSLAEIADTAQAIKADAIEQSPLTPLLVNLADVEPRPVEWLWFGRIALGKVTLISGDPGLGKSFMTLDLAARVSRGSRWPDSPGSSAPLGGVVLLSAEDDLEDTVRPRLDAAGADVKRISALAAVRHNYKEKPGEELFSLATDLPALEDAVRGTPDCKLVIIDPISAYLGDKDSHKNGEIRGLLAPLAAMAAKHHVAVVLIDHLNKNGKGPAIYRSMGSIAFAAAARSVWAVTKDKDDPRRRLMLPVKNNLAPDARGLAYSIEPYGANAGPVVAWEPTPVNISADEALAENGKDDAADSDQAKAWLRDALKDGPMPAADVLAQGEANGFTAKAIRQAFAALGGERKKIGYQGQWQWSLPITSGESLQSLESLGNAEKSLANPPANKACESLSFSKDAQDANDAADEWGVVT